MCLKSCITSICITMLIITNCSTNPIPSNSNDLSLKTSIKASSISGCMQSDHSNVEFFNIKVTGLNDRELRDHQNGNILFYPELQISGQYKDSYHPENEFLAKLRNINIVIQLDNSNKITNVISATIQRQLVFKLSNEALQKCLSEVSQLFSTLTLQYAKDHLIGIVL